MREVACESLAVSAIQYKKINMIHLLTVGVIGKSIKENEKRVAIHPEQIKRIPLKFRKQITFEAGYGSKFGMTDKIIAKLTSGKVASREEILNDFDCVIMPKPLEEDLSELHKGAILWGWTHCVQQKEITQISIERKLTLIAWEQMYKWSKTGDKNMHIFYKNNEIAGYAGVNHALKLIGVIGNYGKPRKAVILSFGSVSRGAVYALQGHGITDITVYTRRKPTDVGIQLPAVIFKQMITDESGNLLSVEADGSTRHFSEVLSDTQIIVNGTLQDIEHPLMFVPKDKANELMNGTLIIDISCDEGMGFWCAKPTTFEHPMIDVDGKFYYSVDHSPSYYWDSASWDISDALLPFIPIVMNGPKAWGNDKTILNAIEINNGIIQNKKIISFQKRDKEYPYKLL